MLINIEARRPMLGFKMGGVTGPALRPIAVRCVYDIYAAVKIPIIGTGGVATGRDAIEMMMAGATAVGVGSAVYDHGDRSLRPDRAGDGRVDDGEQDSRCEGVGRRGAPLRLPNADCRMPNAEVIAEK